MHSKAEQKMDQKAAKEIIEKMKKFVVAVDGPAGTGKSTVTKRISKIFGLTHVDTGALYRGIAYLCSRNKVPYNFDTDHHQMIEVIAKSVQLEFVKNKDRNPSSRLMANGKDITDFIRTPEISMMASRVSALPQVREALFNHQKKLGLQQPSILEGRDIGTVIFPDAEVKIFLTASVDERTKRRLAEMEASGADTPSYEELKQQIQERDLGDSSRSVAPLKKADDAFTVDTTTLTLDQVVEEISQLIIQKLQSSPGKK